MDIDCEMLLLALLLLALALSHGIVFAVSLLVYCSGTVWPNVGCSYMFYIYGTT